MAMVDLAKMVLVLTLPTELLTQMFCYLLMIKRNGVIIIHWFMKQHNTSLLNPTNVTTFGSDSEDLSRTTKKVGTEDRICFN